MAKVKDYLQDILKQIEKQDEPTARKIEKIKEELENFQDFTGYETEREKDLKRALLFLEEQQKKEQITQDYKNEIYNNKIINYREQTQKKEAYSFFKDYFIEKLENTNEKTKMFIILQNYDVIKSLVNDCKSSLYLYDIDLTSEYLKALNDTRKIFNLSLKVEKNERKQKEADRRARTEARKKLYKNITAFNVGLLAVQTLADRKR